MSGDLRGLDRAFNPRVVAVVGDKQANNYMWLRSLSTFAGKLYSVQVDPRELPGIQALGVPNYLSLLDIPEPVDYVVVAVPREVAPRIVADCVKKGVGGAALFTSGFAETGTEEGRRLQEAITRLAREGGLSLVGPNCMGIFNPSLGVRNSMEQYAGEGGPVAFLSQSGTHCINFSLVAAANGIKVSKAVSYGNAVVLDSPDYLEYLAQDEATRVIGMYLEGVRDGPRFLRCLRGLAGRKPVVLWKGGQTEEGARAVASHTGSLAHSAVVWQVVARQFGALWADNLDETVDAIKSLLLLKPATGDRVGLIAMTGGQSVVISDAFAKAGLRVPFLSQASYDEFATFFTIIGGSYRNPLDISSNFGSPELAGRMLHILGRDEAVDAVVMEVSAMFLSHRRNPTFLPQLFQILADFREATSKPFLVVVTPGHLEAEAVSLRQRLAERNIPAYPSFERAARALRRFLDYHRFLAARA